MVHVPCSHIGHIARSQPYSFPKGRMETEVLNYKRAVDVWMDPVHKNLVYDHYPSMKVSLALQEESKSSAKPIFEKLSLLV